MKIVSQQYENRFEISAVVDELVFEGTEKQSVTMRREGKGEERSMEERRGTPSNLSPKYGLTRWI